MLIGVATHNPELEAPLRSALDRLGWPNEAVGTDAASSACALIADAEHPALAAADAALPWVLLVAHDGAAPRLPGGAPRVLLRKPFTQAALASALAAALPGRGPRPQAPIALTPALRAIAARVESLARTRLTLAFCGEIGTGKTHWARWAHACSPRARGPLIEVLGAAAGAGEPGRLIAGGTGEGADPIEWSHGGTLLVEEVAELRAEDQLALLRLLVERRCPRGSAVDVRVIATTRRSLAEESAAGRLHPDLAARLRGAELALPPLRERAEEVPALARFLFERAARGSAATQLPAQAELERALAASAPPSNLHELEARVQRWAVLGLGASVRPAPSAPSERARAQDDEPLDLHTLELRAIDRALTASGGDRRRAAQALGIHVRTLRNKLRARALAARV